MGSAYRGNQVSLIFLYDFWRCKIEFWPLLLLIDLEISQGVDSKKKETKWSESDQNSFDRQKQYSKTCLKRPPHGARESGRYRQVVS